MNRKVAGAWLVVVASFLWLAPSGVAEAAEPPGSGKLYFEAVHEGVARIEVKIAGADLKEPVTHRIGARGGKAAEWIAVPLGAGRSIEVRLLDGKGNLLARGTAVENLSRKPPFQILVTTISARTGEPRAVVLSSHRMSIIQLDKKPGKDGTIRFRAQFLDARGKEVQLPPGGGVWTPPYPDGPPGGVDLGDPWIGRYKIPDDKLSNVNPCLCLTNPCFCMKKYEPLRWLQVTAGRGHSCALDYNRSAYCWGENHFGQLGGTMDSLCMLGFMVPARRCRTTLGAVDGGHTFASISAGGEHTCGIDLTTSRAWCWGSNDEGQLGSGATPAALSASATPVAVSGTTTFKSIGAGRRHTCALGTDDLVYCWGDTLCGQAGAFPSPVVPRAISTTQFRFLSVGSEHSCALTKVGNTVMCWGRGDTGQLGIIPTTNPPPQCGPISPTPVAVTFPVLATGPPFGMVAAGGNFTCVASTGFNVMLGAISCIGGQGVTTTLSAGAQHYIAIPAIVSLGGDTDTSDHICALTSAAGHCWGDNLSGRLGIGPANPVVTSPASIVAPPAGYRHIDAGTFHNCGVSTDSELWCWGVNDRGQLGNGDQKNSAVPVRVKMPEQPLIEVSKLKPFNP